MKNSLASLAAGRASRRALAIAGAVFFLRAALCPAQSFDCSKAATPAEKAICSDAGLSAADAALADTYQALLGSLTAAEKSGLRAKQKLWIGKRDGQCMAHGAAAQAKCLRELIDLRHADLQERLGKTLGLSPAALAWVSSYASPRDIKSYADQIRDRLGSCHGIPPALNPKFASLTPGTYTSLFATATHQCDAVLRVYLSCPAGQDCSERLILEDVPHGQARILADLKPESRTGNSGGIFVPVAFTRDGRQIILMAWMGSPGAGGGAVNYGYEAMTRQGGRKPLAPSGAMFYDEFGKVVYTRSSDKLPAYSQPGPESNDGILAVKDLGTLAERTLLEEADTSYQILKVNEKNHALSLRATRHEFGPGCPRTEEDALRCSKKTSQERQIPLP
ncbi:MAG TPA: lysozyme inhibitor LprI family protein [Candidatus Angelobacter sp.]|nr:lysozyme inhibitor LprI family protein [Candidatus Angelobacter sp.]